MNIKHTERLPVYVGTGSLEVTVVAPGFRLSLEASAQSYLVRNPGNINTVRNWSESLEPTTEVAQTLLVNSCAPIYAGSGWLEVSVVLSFGLRLETSLNLHLVSNSVEQSQNCWTLEH